MNILGDSIGAGIVNHLCRKDLEKPHYEDDEENEIENETTFRMSMK